MLKFSRKARTTNRIATNKISFVKSNSPHTISFVEGILGDILKWKLLAFVFFLIAVLAVFGGSIKKFSPLKRDFIATIKIDGIIETDAHRTEILTKLQENKHLKGVFLKINSPGGTITGSEILYNEIKKLSQKVPVYALIYDVGASGAYMVAVGSTKVFAHRTSITGSIGVLMQTLEAHKLAEKIGAKYKIYRSVKYKAQPNPFEETTPEINEYMQSSINEGHEFFANLVKFERNIPLSKINDIANGKIFSGKEALELNLIDEISTEDGVKKQLKEMLDKQYSKDLDFSDVSLKKDENAGFISQIIDEIIGNGSEKSSKIQVMAIMK